MIPQKTSKRRSKHAKNDRGVILIMVVSLLVLFMLLGVTFFAVTSQYRDAAVSQAAKEVYGDDPRRESDDVMFQLLHDVETPNLNAGISDVSGGSISSLWGWSLLRDKYGREGFKTVLPIAIVNPPPANRAYTAVSFIANGQFVDVTIGVNPSDAPASHAENFWLFSNVSGYYNGREITFLTGPCREMTTRIVGYFVERDVTTKVISRRTFRLLAFKADSKQTASQPDQLRLQLLPQAGNVFLINDPPFDGTGAGYWYNPDDVDTLDFNIEQLDVEMPLPRPPGWMPPPPIRRNLIATLPHYRGYATQLLTNNINAGFGGTDEPYDAHTIDDYHIAFVPSPTAQYYQNDGVNPPGYVSYPANYVSPSFHQPALVHYWFNRLAYVVLDSARIGGAPLTLEQKLWVVYFPYGKDGVLGTADDPIAPNPMGLNVDMSGVVTDLALPPVATLTPPQQVLAYLMGIQRKVFFRPMPSDHPEFTGSNRAFSLATYPSLNAPTNTYYDLKDFHRSMLGLRLDTSSGTFVGGSFDVDNDNDGTADSIWLDPGLPVLTGANGRHVKRLAAIMVRELDSRLNVNAHGSLAQVSDSPPGFTTPINALSESPLRDDAASPLNLPARLAGAFTMPTGSPITAYTPRGMGVGPADVNLGGLFTSPAIYRSLLTNRYAFRRPGLPIDDGWPGRYFSDGVLSQRKFGAFVPGFGLMSLTSPSYDNNAFFTWNYSPLDVHGRGAITLDKSGKPMFYNASTPIRFDGVVPPIPPAAQYYSDTFGDPYELNLNDGGNFDSPYTVGDLEQVLRFNDLEFNSSLNNPQGVVGEARLLSAISPNIWPNWPDAFNPILRNSITTHSSHIPTPYALSRKLYQDTSTATPRVVADKQTTAIDWFVRRMNLSTLNPVDPSMAPPPSGAAYAGWDIGLQQEPTTPTVPNDPYVYTYDVQLARMLPFEVLRGQRMNLNRLLSYPTTITDDVGTDYPINSAVPPIIRMMGPIASPTPTPILPNQRQLLARHLYCMAMFLVDPQYLSSTAFAAEYQEGNPPYTPPALTTNQKYELFARRIAQWAVNVVDFRDPDGVMTAFEYDVNPFNGWSVDGVLTDVNQAIPDDDGDDNNLALFPERRLVWGCESPDLLITETLATHDRGTRDTSFVGGLRSTGDPDLDQVRVPEGSLFAEFYAPRNSLFNNQRNPQAEFPAGTPNLYNAAGNLELSARVGNVVTGSPVWLVAISPDLTPGSPTEADGPVLRFLSKPDSTEYRMTYDAAAPNPYRLQVVQDIPTLVAGTTPIPIDRYILFTNALAPTGPGSDPERTYYNNGGGSLAISPGNYFVVGPRAITHFGMNRETTTSLLPTVRSPQAIVLTPGNVANGVSVYDLDTVTATPPPIAPYGHRVSPDGVTHVKNYVTMIATADPASTGWTRRIPLSISEPRPATVGYYTTEPTTPAPWQDFYTDPTSPGAGVLNTPYDQTSVAPAANPRLVDLGMLQTATYFDRRSMFLMRLADPRFNWNPSTNPYITVDWASIDLTVFNGLDDTRKPPVSGSPFDSDALGNPVDPDPVNNQTVFATRERGSAGGAGLANIWSPFTYSRDNAMCFPAQGVTRLDPRDATADQYFRLTLVETLGYVNSSLSTTAGASYFYGGASAPPVRSTQPFVLPVLTPAPSTPLPLPSFTPENNGEPARSLPWMAWNNRPYANAMEMMFVPSSSAARLGYEYRPTRGDLRYNNIGAPGDAPSGEFRHMASFFRSSMPPVVIPPATATPQLAANLQRIFDFVEVPSPFAGTEQVFSDTDFNGGVPAVQTLGYSFPYNTLSKLRDPGRINLNMVYEPSVIQGIFQLDPSGTFTRSPVNVLNRISSTRQGFVANSADTTVDPLGIPLPINKNYPTWTANPFRASGASELAARFPATPSATEPLTRKDPVEATFLRREFPPIPTPFPIPGDQPPLFRSMSEEAYAGVNPNLEFRDETRNPYLRYQPLQKIGNIASTQSNVYAIWITVGYFEATPVTADEGRRDGLRIGQEIGADGSTNIKRNRSFYIIDRSVPVAFEPGKRHNLERTIMLRRQITK